MAGRPSPSVGRSERVTLATRLIFEGPREVEMADVKTDVAEVTRSLDLTETVAEMRRQIETLQAEVDALKRRA